MKWTTSTFRVYLAAALCLLALTLLAYNVVDPLNMDTVDNWYVIFGGLPNVMLSLGQYAARPLALGGSFLAHTLMPNTTEGIFLVHVISFFIASFCIFYIIQKLFIGYTWFAFLTA
ncbi:MAG TPA: hypothetical protein VKQ72_00470, partial [Aggregatilineales bacterium]|nr:hypothetical protein [Aggregatilineales bacterium]